MTDEPSSTSIIQQTQSGNCGDGATSTTRRFSLIRTVIIIIIIKRRGAPVSEETPPPSPSVPQPPFIQFRTLKKAVLVFNKHSSDLSSGRAFKKPLFSH